MAGVSHFEQQAKIFIVIMARFIYEMIFHYWFRGSLYCSKTRVIPVKIYGSHADK